MKMITTAAFVLSAILLGACSDDAITQTSDTEAPELTVATSEPSVEVPTEQCLDAEQVLLEWNAELFDFADQLADDEMVDVDIPSTLETQALLTDLANLGTACGSLSDRYLATWLGDVRSHETHSNPRVAVTAEVVRLGICPGLRDLWVALIGPGAVITESQAVCNAPPAA